MDLHCAEDEKTINWYLQMARLNARTLGLDCLDGQPSRREGSAASSPDVPFSPNDVLRYEMKKRVWRAIVSREWCQVQNSSVCTIHPNHFTTPCREITTMPIWI